MQPTSDLLLFTSDWGGDIMKVFSVFGISGSGKTTTIENIIQELRRRRYSVGSIKEIHFEDFTIETEGTNTDRHCKAGSELVTARGYNETDILYPVKLSLDDILKHYSQDYVVIEGIDTGNFPKIITAKNVNEIEERLDETVIAIAGIIANDISEYKGFPVINAIDDKKRLVDLIEEKVFTRLPDFPSDCCAACNYSCRELGIRILQGRAVREDCVIGTGNVKLYIGGKEIEMVSFVQNILHNTIRGMVSELEGYKRDCSIELWIGGRDGNCS